MALWKLREGLGLAHQLINVEQTQCLGSQRNSKEAKGKVSSLAIFRNHLGSLQNGCLKQWKWRLKIVYLDLSEVGRPQLASAATVYFTEFSEYELATIF